jgi:hypothetical protein
MKKLKIHRQGTQLTPFDFHLDFGKYLRLFVMCLVFGANLKSSRIMSVRLVSDWMAGLKMCLSFLAPDSKKSNNRGRVRRG